MKNNNHFKINALFTLLVVLIIFITFLVNSISYIVSSRNHLKFDLTANAAYEVGDETQTVLASLTDSIDIYVLATPDSFDGNLYFIQARNIIEQYPKLSDQINLEYIDYKINPAFAASYPDLSLSAGNILISYGEKVKQIPFSKMFNYTYDATGNPVIVSSRAEEAITSTIINVISEEQISIAILTGNGASDMPDFVNLLVDNNYEVSHVNMAIESFDDYDACMLFAPTIDLSEEVIQKIDAYLNNNGEYGKILFYTADATQPPLGNLEAFLSEWGIIIGDGSIFETSPERTYQYQPFFPVAQHTDTKYQKMLRDPNAAFLMPLSKPIDVLYEVQDRQHTNSLISFYDTAGIRPNDAGEDFDSSMAEAWGPFPGIVSASRRVVDSSGTQIFSSEIILSASTYMLEPELIYNPSLSNSEYILNLINDKTGREDAFTVEAKSLSGNLLGITTKQSTRIAIVLCVVAPLSILAAGISIWLYRRYK